MLAEMRELRRYSTANHGNINISSHLKFTEDNGFVLLTSFPTKYPAGGWLRSANQPGCEIATGQTSEI